MDNYHVPVLLKESVDLLVVQKDGVYVDVTFGAGGHSKEILNRLSPEAKLIVFDQDPFASQNILSDPRVIYVDSNFRYLGHYLSYYGIEKVDGVLADLGVSSFQFDSEERGFSYRFDALLDMRMNPEMTYSASDVLQEYREEELVDVFSAYGEVRNSKSLARAIVQSRNKEESWSVQRFNALLDKKKMGNQAKYYAQVYQALRIEVNDEVNALKEMLTAATEALKSKGRLVVISYHSLEDRLAKNIMKKGNVEGKVEQDDFGNRKLPLKNLTRQVILSDDLEIKNNSRAKSAKLRAAEKI